MTESVKQLINIKEYCEDNAWSKDIEAIETAIDSIEKLSTLHCMINKWDEYSEDFIDTAFEDASIAELKETFRDFNILIRKIKELLGE